MSEGTVLPPIVAPEANSELAELSQAVASQESRESILQRLVETACAVLEGCTTASITIVDRGRPATPASTDDAARAVDQAQYDTGAGPCLRALRNRKPVFARLHDPRWPLIREAAIRHRLVSALSVPLLVGEYALGGLNLYTADPDGLRSQADEVAASLLAEQGAVAFAAAQALEMERRTALTLQRSLLPGELPVVAGYDLAASYHPAGSTAEVGGDWYDAFLVDEDGSLAVVVGDATGHGLEAAALMGQVRTGLRAYALEGRDPTTCLGLLSNLIDMAGGESDFRFATACMVLVDTATGMCRVANAGHPPPVLREPDGTIRFVGGMGGAPIGVTVPGLVDDDFVALEPGAVLVLFTDGLVEDRRRSVDRGLGELADALAEPVTGTGELCERLVATLQADRLQEDDVAVLALRRLT
ncbi:MAG: SpoIIE family protein phosphatase [Actinomycetota bacterium]|nr:SpoIIE family protein phosphatase [Actinomycetota bacterium]